MHTEDTIKKELNMLKKLKQLYPDAVKVMKDADVRIETLEWVLSG